MTEKIHQGRTIERFGEKPGLKPEGLAYEPGEDGNQKKVSLPESKEIADDELPEEVLKVPEEATENSIDEGVIHMVPSPFDADAAVVNHNPVFNSLEKLLQLHEEMIALHERMIKEKEDMTDRIQSTWDEIKNKPI